MVLGESPAVARRRLRLALRAAREAKGFTQGHVAVELEWSLSKVNRIESGDVTVSRTDLLAMLELYGVNDRDQVDDLVRAARTSRQRGWWDEPLYREHLTPAMLQLLQFESQASAIRFFHPTLLPGVLQTPAYAEFVLNFWNRELSDADRRVRFDARMRRRDQVLGRPDPPNYYLVLDESVLSRVVGGAQIMAEQLHQLLDLMKNSTVTVRVVPFTKAAFIALLGPFTVLDIGEEENAVLYREGHLEDDIVHVRDEVNRHRAIFEQLWDAALTPSASARLIEARALHMLSSLDRDFS
jgi:transcriptional regulator with XRE-family HTH domain